MTNNNAQGEHAERVNVIRASLEAYLTSIESYYVRYERRFVDDEEKLSLGSESLGAHNRREYLVAYPSYRYTYTNLRVAPDDRGATFTKVVHNGRLTQISANAHTAGHRASNQSDWEFYTAVDAIGYRVLGTRTMRLSDCLRHPEYVTFEGEETIEGIAAIRLKVGPGLPTGSGPERYKEQRFWMRLWVAPQYDYLPVRWSLYKGKDNVKWFVNTDFRPAPDRLRNKTRPFPHSILEKSDHEGNVAVNQWIIEEIEFNPSITDDSFHITIPDAFLLNVDGKVVRRRLVGGDVARQKRLKEIATESQELLKPNVDVEAMRASATTYGYVYWLVGIACGGAFFVAAVCLWKRRG